MRIVIQKVKQASVSVGGRVVSEIGPGLMCLVGVENADGPDEAAWGCKQILSARLFDSMNDSNAGKRWRSSVKQNAFEVLLVSQFTLSGRISTKKGSLDFSGSMETGAARAYYEDFVARVKEAHSPALVKDGVFGAMMEVALVNDGPVTLTIDSASRAAASQGESVGAASKSLAEAGAAAATPLESPGDAGAPAAVPRDSTSAS